MGVPLPIRMLMSITSKLKRKFPALDHLERNAVIDGDTYMLHVAVSRARAQLPPVGRSAHCMLLWLGRQAKLRGQSVDLVTGAVSQHYCSC